MIFCECRLKENMSTETIDSRRLYRQIADQISHEIESGVYKPGDRLPAERTLAEHLSVSRPTVREALIALEVEGRVEIRGGAGVFVIEPALNSIANSSGIPMPGPFDVLSARDLIESEVAALAARNASDAQVTAMSQALGDMVCCLASDPKHVEYDRRFHFALAEASGNSALAMASQMMWSLREQPLYLQLEVHFHTEAIWQRLIIEHREILAAVKSRDAKAARSAMHRHMKIARKRFVSSWQETPAAQ
jgi:DNA-binding FadR family transcriptional regulator